MHFQDLKSVAEYRGFVSNNGNNIEAVSVLDKIVVGNKFLGRAAQFLLFLPVDKFPGLAKITRTARLHFHEYQGFAFERDNIQLPGAAAVAAGQDVESLPQKKSACDPFPLAPLKQVRCKHNMFLGAPASRRQIQATCGCCTY
jgi:hypothetical protein